MAYEFELSTFDPNPRMTFLGPEGQEILRLDSNGDIYVKGRLVENDKEVVDGLRSLLLAHNRCG